jgi:hypothetical protein
MATQQGLLVIEQYKQERKNKWTWKWNGCLLFPLWWH